MDYEQIIKLISVILGSGVFGSLMWNARKMYEIYEKSKIKKLHLTRSIGGEYELDAEGKFADGEILLVIKQLNAEKPKNASLQLIKTRNTK